MNLPTGRRGRMIALALLAIVTLLLTRFVLQPSIRYYQDSREEVADMRHEIAQLERLLARTPVLKRQAERLALGNSLDVLTLEGDSATLAAADLQEYFQEIARRSALQITSLRVRSAEEPRFGQRLSLEARLQGEIGGLRNLLFSIAHATPYLFIERLSIRSRASRRRNTVQNLDIQINLHAYWNGEDAAPGVLEDKS